MSKKNSIIRVIRIDIEKSIPRTFEYKNYKNDGFLNFLILEDNQEVDLSDYTAKVFFDFSKDDFFSIQCNIVENIVRVPLSEILIDKKGLATFEIVFTGKRQRVTTFKMYLKI